MPSPEGFMNSKCCQRQEECSQVLAEVIAIHNDDPKLDRKQVEEVQQGVPVLFHVRGWLESGKRPEWCEISVPHPMVT